jgi:predicted porin
LENFSMKKTLIALAAVAVSSAAMAQVTISGAIAGQQNKTGTAKAVTSVAVSELTFRATEDLGGGMTASGFFTIENMNNRGDTQVKDATGKAYATGATQHTVANGPTNADSGISLRGGFGTVAINNTRAGNLAANANVFGTSISNGFYESVADTRSNVQVLSYTSPALIPGLNVSLARASVGNTAASQAAEINIIGASYSAGPLSLGVQQKSFNAAGTATGAENKQTEGFVRYDAGVAVIGYGMGTKTTTTGKAVTSYGISVPMGAITLGVEGAERGDEAFINYGVRYALSKRTALHVSAGKWQNTATDSAKQSRIRIAHSF